MFWNFLAFLMIQWMLTIWSLFFGLLKSSLNFWKFSVHFLLKPDLENFEHYFASVWNELQHVWDELWLLQHVGFLIMACKLLDEASKTYISEQWWNPGPLHWEFGVLTTEPEVKSLILNFLKTSILSFIVTALIYTPNNTIQVFPILYTLADNWYFLFYC